jgi:hypothetical protein
MINRLFDTIFGQVLAIIAEASALTFLLFLPAIEASFDRSTAATQPGLAIRLTQAPLLCGTLRPDA